jgi:hypothetical protein
MIKVEYPKDEIKEMTKEELKKTLLLEKEEDATTTIFYHGFKLDVVSSYNFNKKSFPTYTNCYCGYLDFPKNFNVDLSYFRVNGGWSYGNGFDCAHGKDITLRETFRYKLNMYEIFMYYFFNTLNLDDLYEYNINKHDKDATFKSKEYVFWKLKNVVDEIMETEEYEIYINSIKIVKFVEKYMDDEFEMRNMRRLINLRKFLEINNQNNL